MGTKNKKEEKQFHPVEFMRKVRNEMSKDFENDPDAYFNHLRKVMDDFKKQLKEPLKLSRKEMNERIQKGIKDADAGRTQPWKKVKKELEKRIKKHRGTQL